MVISRSVDFFAVFGLGLVLFAGPASAAALIKTQAPCIPGTAPCNTFNSASAPTVIRQIAFSAPSKGNAAVSITGSMFCSAGFSTPQRVADFVTQIVPAAGTVPDLAGPGALKQAFRLGAQGPDGFGLSNTLNLASTRVFHINAAGPQNYYFKLNTLRMDGSIQCTITQAALTIVFIP
jgi:hypothetical protein